VLRDLAGDAVARWQAEREALRAARGARRVPDTDTKRVAAWNGLTISGLARAATELGDATWLDEAVAAADFVLTAMRDDSGRRLRVWNAGRAHVPAFLDDMAALLEACLDLLRAGADGRFLGAAVEIAEDIAAHFFDASDGDFFLTPDDADPLAKRPRSDHDGATPHSTGLAVFGLLRIASLTGREDLGQIADRVLETNAAALERAAHAFPTLARAALARERGLSVAVIVGAAGDPATQALASRARRVLRPEDAVVLVGDAGAPVGLDAGWIAGREAVGGRPTAYVCRGRTCSLPATDPRDLTPLDADGGSPLHLPVP